MNRPPRVSGSLAVLAALVVSIPATAQEATPRPAPAELTSKLEALAGAHKGKVAIALKHLRTGESYDLNADVPMPTASLIKFPVMIEVYRQAAAGKVDLASTITLREQDKAPGSGILTDHFSAGATFPLVDAVHLMIVYSDNTATNLVLDAIGIGSTAATMEKMGLPETKIHSKVFRRDTSVFMDRSKKYGLGSTTAADMVKLLELLDAGKLVDEKSSAAMRKHMLACDDKDKFPRFLPPGTRVAFKTGGIDDARTCAGIIETRGGPVALCVLTDENEDQSWRPDNAGNLLCARAAQEVHEYFSARASEPSNPE